MNIRFEYLYRDWGNNKRWNQIVFSNPQELEASMVESQARKLLIDSQYFVAIDASVPDLHFDSHDSDLDHGWHEAHAFVPTEETPDDPQNRDIAQFLDALRHRKP